MSPKLFIVTCYHLLIAANGMSADDPTMSESVWASQDAGIYGGIWKAYNMALDQVYGDLAGEMRESIGRSFGDDLCEKDLDQMAALIVDERYNDAVSHAVAVAADAVHEAWDKMKVGDSRRDLMLTIRHLVATLTYPSDGDDADVLSRADDVKRCAEMRKNNG